MRWRWVILGIVVLSGLAGLIITLMMTPQYTAATRMEISREEKRITNIEGVESSSGNRFDQEFYQTQYTLLGARSVAERVARVLKLADDDAFFKDRDKAAVIDILARRTTIQNPQVWERMSPAWFSPDALPNLEQLLSDQDFYLQHGYISQRADLAAVVDPSYAEQALQRLGRYQP